MNKRRAESIISKLEAGTKVKDVLKSDAERRAFYRYCDKHDLKINREKEPTKILKDSDKLNISGDIKIDAPIYLAELVKDSFVRRSDIKFSRLLWDMIKYYIPEYRNAEIDGISEQGLHLKLSLMCEEIDKKNRL